MYLAVKKVQPLSNYHLIITFSNDEKRQFDMNPYLEIGIFKELKDIALFNSVRVSFDTIEWDNEADMDPETLYNESTAIETQIASEPTNDYGINKQP
jgi:hypothetical protein